MLIFKFVEEAAKVYGNQIKSRLASRFKTPIVNRNSFLNTRFFNIFFSLFKKTDKTEFRAKLIFHLTWNSQNDGLVITQCTRIYNIINEFDLVFVPRDTIQWCVNVIVFEHVDSSYVVVSNSLYFLTYQLYLRLNPKPCQVRRQT